MQRLTGTLYIVATPIGNLEDITLRALRVLRDEVATIACEDTRQTKKLLTHYAIRKPLLSYHEHNEVSRTAELIQLLRDGESIALVSDAGTPLLSDPGFRVVNAAVEAGIRVVPVPGATAALSALTGSGLPTDSFLFLGFLPLKPAALRKRLESVAGEQATLVAYESPHRILETLTALHEVWGERRVILARELTKIHEEFLRGTAAEIRGELESRPSIKGEITLVIAGAEESRISGDPAEEVWRREAEGIPRMEAIKSVAKQMQLPKREVYRRVAERDSNPQGRNRDLDQTDQ
ncbi:MAG: 16S rRNA (cytidine(1402)-2'-O)-methyltransferase [Acidobacteriaceae bacterium]|nr:16S rRNA (cytidine(1402)-2'-O)-methyltransferase [Acidobacteriaceae bacterium]